MSFLCYLTLRFKVCLDLGIAGVDSHTKTVDQVLLLLEKGLIKLVWYAESGWNKGFRRAEVGVGVVRQHTCGRCVGNGSVASKLSGQAGHLGRGRGRCSSIGWS